MPKENRHPLPVAVFVGGLALVLAAGDLVLTTLEERLISNQLAQVSEMADVKSHLVRRRLDEVFQDAQVFAQLEIVKAAVSESRQPDRRMAEIDDLRSFGDSLRDVYGYSHFRVIKLSSRGVVAQSGESTELEFQNALQELRQDGLAHLVDMHLSSDGLAMFGLVAPVKSGAGQGEPTNGAIYLEGEAPRFLWEELERQPADVKSAETLLIRRDDSRLTLLSQPKSSQGPKPLLYQGAPEALGLAPPEALDGTPFLSRDFVDYRGVSVLMAVRPVPGTSWLVVSKVDKSDVLAPLKQLKLSVTLIGAFILLLFAGLSIALAKIASEISAKKSLALYDSAVAASGDAVALLDAQGCFLKWNASAASLFHDGKLRGKCIREVVKFPESKKIEAAIKVSANVRVDGIVTLPSGAELDIDVSIASIPNQEPPLLLFYARDVTEPRLMARQLTKLNKLYLFLVEASQALESAATIQEALDATCRIAVDKGEFAAGWAGMPDASFKKAVPVCAYGPAREYVSQILVTLDSWSATSLGPTGVALREGRTVVVQDFVGDPRTAPWRDMGGKFGLKSSISLPIFVDRRPVAAIVFYATQTGFFEDELVVLLNRLARMVSVACQAIVMGGRAVRAENEALDNERKYEAIFQSSPAALMFIGDDQKLKLNDSLKELFEYDDEDVPDLSAWFEKVYSDPSERKAIRALWQSDVARLRETGARISSPTLKVTTKTGQVRVVRGRATLVPGGIIFSWTEL